MIDLIRACRRVIQDLRATLSRVRSQHVNREEVLDEVRGVVDGYFRGDRPILLHKFRNEDLFANIDGQMQQLLRFTQSRTPTTRYISTLKRLEKEWGELEVNSISMFGDLTGGEVPELEPIEAAIIDTLERLSPAAAKCYRQAIEDLRNESRLSWRGTATEFREALREALDTLAPDEDVEQSPGFKLEKDARAPTMKQKAAFILKSRRQTDNARKSVQEAIEVVEEKVGAFVRLVYSRSSGSVHAEREKDELISIKRFVDTVLQELLAVK